MFDTAPPDRTPLQDTYHPLMQDPAFANALRAVGQTPLVLPSGLVVLQQRFAGLRVAMVPRAPVPDDIAGQLRRAGVRRLPLILSPETPQRPPRALRLRAPVARAVIDLRIPPAERRRALHVKWRNQLTKAEGANLRVRVTPAPAQASHRIYRLETEQSRTRRYSHWPCALTAAFAALAPEQTHLFTATHLGHVAYLDKLGCETLDLGVMNDRTPTLNRFKTRGGAKPHLTGGTWGRFVM